MTNLKDQNQTQQDQGIKRFWHEPRYNLAIIAAFFWCALYLHVPYQTQYLYDLGTSSLFVGLIIGSYGIGQTLFRIPIGISCDLGKSLSKYMLFGMVGALCSSLLRLIFHNSIAFLFANILGGLAAAQWIAILGLAAKLFPSDRLHDAMSFIMVSYSVGMLASSLGCIGLVSIGKMPAIVIGEIVVASLGLLMTIYFLKTYRQSQIKAGAATNQASLEVPTYREILATVKIKQIWQFALLAFVQQGIIMTMVMSFASNQAKKIGLGPAQMAFSTLLYWIITILTNYMSGRSFAKRLGARIILPVCFGVAACYCLLLLYVKTPLELYALQMLGGIFGGMVLPFSLSSGMTKVPLKTRNSGLGVFQAVLAAGMVLLPMATGALLELIGKTGSFYIMALIALLAALASIHLTQPGKI